MSGVQWDLLRRADTKALSRARLQAHYAAQFLAAAARAFIKPEPDDSHTSLAWDAQRGGFATNKFDAGGRLVLALASLDLIFETAAGASVSVPLHGRSLAEARASLAATLQQAGFDAKGLDDPPPYSMPDDVLARDGRFDAAALAPLLQAHAAWFGHANAALEATRAIIRERRLETPQPRLWPHHFDLATLTSFPAEGGATAYVGAGYSPGDHYYDEPYFYVSIYPRRDPASLPLLPPIGHWHEEDFLAAVAPSHAILARPDPSGDIKAFLSEAIGAAISASRPSPAR